MKAHQKLVFLCALILTLSIALASTSTIVSTFPSEANITAFRTGFQEVTIFVDNTTATEATINSTDFTIIGSNIISIDNGSISFNIIGDTPGTKNFDLVLDSETIPLSIDISSTEMDIDGPFVLTDFNFSPIYAYSPTITFSCYGSHDFPVDCNTSTQYSVNNGNWIDYNFDTPISFTTEGTQLIEVKATNLLGLSSSKTFELTIQYPKPSSGGGSRTVVSGAPLVTNTVTDNNDTNTIEPQQVDNNLNEIDNNTNNTLEINDSNNTTTDTNQSTQLASSATGLFGGLIPDISQQYPVFIMLLLIIMVLIVAFLIIKKVKK